MNKLRIYCTSCLIISSYLITSNALGQGWEVTNEERFYKFSENKYNVNAKKFKTQTALNCRRGVGVSYPIVTVIPQNSVVENQEEQAYVNTNDPSTLNVGFDDNNGFWVMVLYNREKCFVRASEKYLATLPETQTTEDVK